MSPITFPADPPPIPESVQVERDAEAIVVDYLIARLDAIGRPSPVGTDLPDGWAPRSGAFVQVALDGTPTVEWPVRTVATIRVTVWSRTKGEGKELSGICMGLLLTHPGGSGVSGIRPGIGRLLAKDDNGGRLTSFTVDVSLRTRALPV